MELFHASFYTWLTPAWHVAIIHALPGTTKRDLVFLVTVSHHFLYKTLSFISKSSKHFKKCFNLLGWLVAATVELSLIRFSIVVHDLILVEWKRSFEYSSLILLVVTESLPLAGVILKISFTSGRESKVNEILRITQADSSELLILEWSFQNHFCSENQPYWYRNSSLTSDVCQNWKMLGLLIFSK